MRRFRLSFLALLCLAGFPALPARAQRPAQSGPPDACKTVSGQAAAQALGGRLLEVHAVPPGESGSSKCTYAITTTGSTGEVRTTIVLWVLPAGDFEAMRKGQEKPADEIKGLGDAAFQIFHDDTKRFDLVAWKRGHATVEVTADAAEPARKIAELALERL